MSYSGIRTRSEKSNLTFYSPNPFKRVLTIPSSTTEASWDTFRSMFFVSPDFGFMAFDDFTPGRRASATEYDGFTITEYTDGNLEMQDEVGGVLGLKTTTTLNQGIQMQSMGESWKPEAGKKIWFECKARISTLIGYVELFIGLIETNADIADGSTPAAVNTIGFRKIAAAAAINTQVSTGAVAPVASSTNFLVDDYHHLGFFVDGVSSVTFYATNGVEKPAIIRTVTTNIPTTEMALSFGVRRTTGANENSLFLDWYKIVQTR
jgi:hypothetical protein